MAFPPRASFRFCRQYLMSDSAAAADWQAQLPIAYSREGASREAAAEHGAAPRGKSTNFNTRNGCLPG